MATECKIHGLTFKGPKGLEFHRTWCKPSAKPKKAKAAKPTKRTSVAGKASKRAPQAGAKKTATKPVETYGWDDLPTADWLQVYADEVGAVDHKRACARAFRATGVRVSWKCELPELPGPSGTTNPTHNRTRPRSAKLTTGRVHAATMPGWDLLDKNGAALHGAALERRVAKLQRAHDAGVEEATARLAAKYPKTAAAAKRRRDARAEVTESEREASWDDFDAEPRVVKTASVPTAGHDVSERLDAFERVMLQFGDTIAVLAELVGDMRQRELEREAVFSTR